MTGQTGQVKPLKIAKYVQNPEMDVRIRPNYRAMLAQSAVMRQLSRLSVCLSVRLSVTIRYHDHIGWNSSKIISAKLYIRRPLQT